MQKLPLMSHGGPGHVPRAGLYWHNLLAGRSAGWLASASRPLASARRPHLLIEDALLLGLRFGPLTTFLAALLACLLTCVRVAWFTPPSEARKGQAARAGAAAGGGGGRVVAYPSDCSGLCHDNMPCTAVLR